MGGNILGMMKQIARHPVAGFVLSGLLLLAVILVPALRESVVTAWGSLEELVIWLPTALLSLINWIF
jgi:hypothetical protein